MKAPSRAIVPREISDADHKALLRERPKHVTDGVIGASHWWLALYASRPWHLLYVWSDVRPSRHVWFPNATPRSIRDWVLSNTKAA